MAGPKPAPDSGKRRLAPESVSGVPIGIYTLGFAGVLVAAASATMLALEALGGIKLPGCGAESACAQLASGPWGKIPGIGWPVSFVGAAYFAAALVAWAVSRGGVPAMFKNIVRLGMAASVGFFAIMIGKGIFCQYCLGVHVGNLFFWLAVELSGKRPVVSMRPVVATVLVFALASVGLGAARATETARVKERDNQRIDDSTDKIIAKATGETSNQPAGTTVVDVAPSNSNERPIQPAGNAADVNANSMASAGPSSDTTPSTADATPPANATELTPPVRRGFTGRYRTGPEKAPIRIVMITDYQCPDCYAVEGKAREILANRDDVSLSIKNFPMCMDCNPNFQSKNLHPNACWAARAAETAGLLYGNEGFWEMHHWLFDRKGVFTGPDLDAGLAELGFEPTEFKRVLMDESLSLAPVQRDIQEAIDLGLHYTPMVFINGVQVRGLFEHTAQRLVLVVDKLARQNLPAHSSENDLPIYAKEKYIDDLLIQPQRGIPPDQHPFPMGPADAPVEVVIWGDLQEPYTAIAVDEVQAMMAERGNLRLSFRDYPVSKDCNEYTGVDKFPLACMAAKALHAAGTLGGNDVYWQMHKWLRSHRETLSEETLRREVADLNLDPTIFFATMDSAVTAEAISHDCLVAKNLGLRSIPMIFINGKFAPRWNRPDDPGMLKEMINAVAEGRQPRNLEGT